MRLRPQKNAPFAEPTGLPTIAYGPRPPRWKRTCLSRPLVCCAGTSSQRRRHVLVPFETREGGPWLDRHEPRPRLANGGQTRTRRNRKCRPSVPTNKCPRYAPQGTPSDVHGRIARTAAFTALLPQSRRPTLLCPLHHCCLPSVKYNFYKALRPLPTRLIYGP
jgi:hypothetical protein